MIVLLALASSISGNVNAPITIAGIQTNVGTVLVGVFVLAMVLMGVAFSPGSKGKTHRSSGMGFLVFIVFLVGMYAVGLMAR